MTTKLERNWICLIFGHDYENGYEYDDRELTNLHSFMECVRCGNGDRQGKRLSQFNFLMQCPITLRGNG